MKNNKTPDYEEKLEFRGRHFFLKEYFDDDFSGLKKETQCYGVILNDKNEVLLVSEDNIDWSLPGGTPEEGETYEQTLIREVYEESAVLIDKSYILPFFYVLVDELLNDEWGYHTTQLRFISKVKRIDDFVKDPGGNVKYRKFVPLEDLDKRLQWKNIAPIIKSKLKEKLGL